MKLIAICLSLFLIAVSPQAFSRDTKHMLSIEAAMASADFKERLDPNIDFYFGSQKHPKVNKTFGNFSTNKKTNAFNKSDEEACQWVLLSALISLQDRVKAEGGNAVINIASYYKKNKVSHNTQYECHAGAIMAGVALTGEVVKLAK
ncbi:phosphoribosylglycinamide formyltransferase [Marinobacterium zhoushanense]|uniref:Phosphoribosylglycinamide formyltransferase n=1 Tax=Marinobacterium zhoushanense TaxID=1679163 RepID=A0ABQ1K151_9GAMM|nr:excinuclease ATPase subunit [Marinobacterium zhoushanense]GGB81055.1 phosphoribosylglycinamide formyltransferase [Marinobacterium zhoushanense]